MVHNTVRIEVVILSDIPSVTLLQVPCLWLLSDACALLVSLHVRNHSACFFCHSLSSLNNYASNWGKYLKLNF